MGSSWDDARRHSSGWGDPIDPQPLLGGRPAKLFARRHHNKIADLLFDCIEEPGDFTWVRILVARLATMFRRDNPAFDEEAFTNRAINGPPKR